MHLPTGEQMSIYDASMKYQATARRWSIIAGKEYGSGSSRDWAAKGTAAARRARRDRRELRAHPPLEPGRHGRRAAAVPRLARRAESLGLTGDETFDIVGLGLERAQEVQVTAIGATGKKKLQGRRAHRYAEGAGLLHPRRDSAVRAAAARVGQASGLAPPGGLDERGAARRSACHSAASSIFGNLQSPETISSCGR